MDEPRVKPQRLKELVAEIAEAVEVSAEDAAIFADVLVEADVGGTYTHGVSRLDTYIRRIQKGLIDPRAELVIERERSSMLAVDAGNGLGQVQAYKVLQMLIPKAGITGVAAATIRNSQHFGALSYYCNKAAERGMILLASTNAEPAMSPHGGCEPFFGTNPLGASFPTARGYPIKVDMATSIVARGNIIAAQKRGEKIPVGWALDPEGRPTMDPNAALQGSVLTMAGHRGYALALMVEIFAGVLSGSAVGSGVGSMYKNWDRKQDVGHFFCLIDIQSFMSLPLFLNRVGAMADKIKSCRRQPGVAEVLLPGERSHRTTCENRAKGILLGPEILLDLEKLCDELHINWPLRRVNS